MTNWAHASGWVEAGEWLTRTRRLGPLRYSDLGRRRLARPDAGAVGPLAAWIAGSVDRWWDDAGRSDPYTLTVVSGDDGPLAAAVLAAGPVCAPALRYVAVDPDAAGRAERAAAFARMVDLEDPAFLYPAASAGGRSSTGGGGAGADGGGSTGRPGPDPDELDPDERPPAQAIGPLVTILSEVPSLGEGMGAIVAVEVLSRQPFDLFEWDGREWRELRLAADGDELVQITVPADPDTVGAEPMDAGAPAAGLDVMHRYRQTGAAAWLRAVLPTASEGILAVVDRWAPGGRLDALDLDQLALLREPVAAPPTAIPGTPLEAVTWRLG